MAQQICTDSNILAKLFSKPQVSFYMINKGPPSTYYS